MLIVTLLIASLGGFLFNHIGVPLGWLLGSMALVSTSNIFIKNLYIPKNWRVYSTCVIGIISGSLVNGDTFYLTTQYGSTIIIMLIFQLLLILGGTWFFSFIIKKDILTSFFASFPGGISQISSISLDYKCDNSIIALNHTCRLFFVIATIPLIIAAILASKTSGDLSHVNNVSVEWTDYLWPLLIASVGFYLASRLKIMTPALYGPMIIAIILNVADVFPDDLNVANEYVIAAQIIIGACVGLKFKTTSKFSIKNLFTIHLSFAVALLIFTLVISYVVHKLMGVSFETSLLIFAPGGLSEMILISYTMGIDTVIVTTHHVVRSLFLLLIIPLIIKVLLAKASLHERPPVSDHT